MSVIDRFSAEENISSLKKRTISNIDTVLPL